MGLVYFSPAAFQSHEDNLRDWSRVQFRPRVLRNVKHVSIERTILGFKSSLPFFIAPAASARLGHPDGELCLVRGAARHNILYCPSNSSSVSHEDLVECLKQEQGGGVLFFQLYVKKTEEETISQIRRARALGFKTLVITVDNPVLGMREEDDRYRIKDALEKGEKVVPFWGSRHPLGKDDNFVLRGAHSSTLSWDDLEWIKEEWGNSGPISIKGILTAEDAKIACEMGIQSIYLSNHGGRQIDSAPSSTLSSQRRTGDLDATAGCDRSRSIASAYGQDAGSREKQKTTHLSTPNSTSENRSTIDPESRLESRPGRSPDQNSNTELASRTQTLEQDYEALKRELAWMRDQERDRTTAQQSKPTEAPVGPSQFSPTNTSVVGSPKNVFELNIKVAGGSPFFHQIDVLDRSVARDLGKGDDPMLLLPEEPGSETMDYENLSASVKRDLDQIVDQTRLEDMDKVMQSLDIYFANIQPHYPCINEAHFRAQFAAFLANDTNCMSKSVSVQFAALLNFMMAVGRILYDICTSDDNPPGCKEFSRGEKLLSHATWLEKANITTIQILLIKSSYCLYISRLNAAYDTMGTAIRLCFQLGLHNEPSWGGASCSFYDRTYRQRLFWSLYCLNHNVAQNSGVPDLLCDDDFDVALPSCVDDRMLYPNCPPLPETHSASLIPYLLQIIAWAQLSSTIWDALFGVRVRKPANPAFIAAMDAKILALGRQTPASLLWPPPHAAAAADPAPAFRVQQSFVLYLRIRALRMLLRRGEMVSLRYAARTARLCMDIATDMVAAVELSYSSGGLRRAERYAYGLHLTGALVPVICVIVRRSNGEELIRPAVDLFNRAMRIMEAVAGGLSFARRTLRQLRRPIRVAREIIEANWTQQEAPVQDASGQLGAQNVVATPASLVQSQAWDQEGGMAMDGARREQGVDEWRPAEGELVWEDLDLWNNIIMSNWQS
ncbi:uncharacterized protein BDZ99DRAFT_568584 [Mytilinidion resinicola]|uniref:FMN hydroxy acid dehydrogenase domain-containing protein n=1 Tax=Mytilinidion resinicola TaxID=574789 RepID=A0A6A6YXZ2_9PEZI|nr:uncharacterized protein BDZ99DRAFT_568584 [Mytilinidion resinicola]KAF2813369.1 hypothetical protein BDZ99DRAFT_568584 [Mytilinidion resinicola]